MHYLSLLFLINSWFPQTSPAAPAAEGLLLLIRVTPASVDTLLWGRQLGDQIIFSDTLTRQAGGAFRYEADAMPEAGIYTLFVPDYEVNADVILTPAERRFALDLDAATGQVTFHDAPDNERRQRYLRYQARRGPERDNLNKAIRYLEKQGQDSRPLRERLGVLTEEDQAFRQELLAEDPRALSAAIIRADEGPDTSTNTPAAFLRAAAGDPRLLPSRFFFDRAAAFTEAVFKADPVALPPALDTILEATQGREEAYRWYLSYFLRTFHPSRETGRDAAFVHLVDRYIRTGRADHLPAEERQRLERTADRFGALLPGRVAPDLRLERLDVDSTRRMAHSGDPSRQYRLDGAVDLHAVEADVTVLLFWKPDCSHCVDALPLWVALHDRYREQGLAVVAICFRNAWGMPECADTLAAYGATRWVNAVDPYLRSRFAEKYDVTATPSVFVLGKNKEILMRDVDAAELERVLPGLLNGKKE